MQTLMIVLAVAFGALAIFAFANTASDIQFFAGFNAIGFAVTLSALSVLIGRMQRLEARSNQPEPNR